MINTFCFWPQKILVGFFQPHFFLGSFSFKFSQFFVCVITVFSLDNVKPLGFKNRSIMSFISSSVCLSVAVTIKSSAKRTTCTLRVLYLTLRVFLTLLLQYTSSIIGSSPSSTIFAYVGEITPPYGEPSVVGSHCFLSIYTHLINYLSILLSVGIFSIIH